MLRAGVKCAKKSIKDVDFRGKRAIIRVDFNVPFDKVTGKISNAQRVIQATRTIEYILDHGATSVALMSHLGRPKGHVVPKLSLASVVPVLSDLLNRPVQFVSDCVGEETEKICNSASSGTVLLLENLRFHPEEEGKSEIDGVKTKADPIKVEAFRRSLGRLGDIYVNDAFGTAHRGHSSMLGTHYDNRVAGFLLYMELEYFQYALEHPARPFTIILGGAKVSDKILLINNLLDKVDTMIIGGAMAFTFKKVLDGTSIGDSLFDEEGAKLVQGIMTKAKKLGVKIILPTHFVIADKFEQDANVKTVSDTEGIPEGWFGLDIGPKSSAEAASAIATSKTIIWNGPMGVFEFENFEGGTRSVMDAVVKATEQGCVSIIGGGDTASCAKKFNVEDRLSHISTGGGASLELMEGKVLPGVESLCDK